jgi:hypothetical protein
VVLSESGQAGEGEVIAQQLQFCAQIEQGQQR